MNHDLLGAVIILGACTIVAVTYVVLVIKDEWRRESDDDCQH